MILKTISPSRLDAYANCPQCFLLSLQKGKFQLTESIKFGSRIHKAVENYHKAGQTIFDEDLQDYLAEYIEMYNQDFQECETFWSLPLFDGTTTLKLKMDLIKDDMLIDHKTASRMFSQKEVDEQRQVTAYSWAWSQLYSEREKLVRFNVFLKNPKPGQNLLEVIDTVRTPEDFKDWELWVDDILQSIARDEFDPNPHARWHNYEECRYYKAREVIVE